MPAISAFFFTEINFQSIGNKPKLEEDEDDEEAKEEEDNAYSLPKISSIGRNGTVLGFRYRSGKTATAY